MLKILIRIFFAALLSFAMILYGYTQLVHEVGKPAFKT